jgi:histone H3/H4
MSEILVVTSKVKKYIKDKGEMNCSAAVLLKLSEIVQKECDRAIENARKDKRKTVMDRDFFEG